jgi:hypothetical protein
VLAFSFSNLVWIFAATVSPCAVRKESHDAYGLYLFDLG